MIKKDYFKIFLTALFSFLTLNLFAQVHDENDLNLYMNVQDWLADFEQKTTALIKTSPFLDTTQARKQLAETEGKIAVITKQKLRKKAIEKEKLAKLLKQSTVLFATAYDCGKCHRTHVNPASGYVLDESGVIVTNHHVVEGFCKSGANKNLAMSVQTSDGKVYFVTEILSSNEKADLCIVKIDTKGDKLFPLPLGEAAEQGDEIFVMGHPNQMLFYFTKGLVARNYMGATSRRQAPSMPEMDITADYAAGSSGGPVVDVYGNLVATVSATRSIYYNPTEQKNLQMVVKNTKPVISLKKMIAWR